MTTPPPKTMMPTAAPKAAPCDTPSVEAEARGLCSTHCMTAPEDASIAPTSIAAVTLGSLIPHMTVFCCASPAPKMVFNISQAEMDMEPTPAENTAATIAASAAIMSAARFLRTKRQYTSSCVSFSFVILSAFQIEFHVTGSGLSQSV